MLDRRLGTVTKLGICATKGTETMIGHTVPIVIYHLIKIQVELIAQTRIYL